MRTAINAMVSEIRLTLHIVDATRMVVPRKHSRSPAVLAVLVSVTLNHAPFDTTTHSHHGFSLLNFLDPLSLGCINA